MSLTWCLYDVKASGWTAREGSKEENMESCQCVLRIASRGIDAASA